MRAKRAAIFILCVGVLIVCWIFLIQALPKPNEASWISGIYRAKEAAARQVVGRKAVIIGGSGAHYSYSARLLTELTGIPTVNLGTHAGLGGEYILWRARASLKPGDIAIVALEHQLIFRTKPSSVLATFVLTGDPRYLWAAPLRDVPALLFGYPPVQLIQQIAGASIPYRSPLYRPESVDSWGDETANGRVNKLPYMASIVHALGPVAVAAPDPEAAPQFLKEFAEWAKLNNIYLLQAWPATTVRDAYFTPHYAQYFDRYAETYRRLGFTVLGKPQDYLVPEEEMLDSMYHADSIGATRVSKMAARDICQAFTCALETPHEPAPAQSELATPAR